MQKFPDRIGEFGVYRKILLLNTTKQKQESGVEILTKKQRWIFGILGLIIIVLMVLVVLWIRAPYIVAEKYLEYFFEGSARGVDSVSLFTYEQRFADGVYDGYTVGGYTNISHLDYPEAVSAFYDSIQNASQNGKNIENYAPIIKYNDQQKVSLEEIEMGMKEKQCEALEQHSITRCLMMRYSVSGSLLIGKESQITLYLVLSEGKWKVVRAENTPCEDLVFKYGYLF